MAIFRDAEIWQVAKKQHGLVAYWQLARLGVTRTGLRCRLQSGEWIRAQPSVVRMAWADDNWMQRVWAVWLWAGPFSAISHFTAAALNGLAVARPRTTQVTLPIRFRPRAVGRGVTMYRSRRLRSFEKRKLLGVSITTPARTLVDLAAETEPVELERLVGQALSSNLVTMKDLLAYVGSSRGRRGIGNFRWAVTRHKRS